MQTPLRRGEGCASTAVSRCGGRRALRNGYRAEARTGLGKSDRPGSKRGFRKRGQSEHELRAARAPDFYLDLVEQSREILDRVGNRSDQAGALAVLGGTECDAGNNDQGLQLLEQAVEIAEALNSGFWHVQWLDSLCEYGLELGRIESVEARGRQALALCRSIGDRNTSLHILTLLARAALHRGDLTRAGRLWGAVEIEMARAEPGRWRSTRQARAITMRSTWHRCVPLTARTSKVAAISDSGCRSTRRSSNVLEPHESDSHREPRASIRTDDPSRYSRRHALGRQGDRSRRTHDVLAHGARRLRARTTRTARV